MAEKEPRVVKLLTAGGMGDSVLSYCKLWSDEAPFDIRRDKIELVHATNIRGAGAFSESIQAWYKTQGISARVDTAPKGPGYYNENRSKYDYYLGAGVDAYNGGDEPSWPISPTPKIYYNPLMWPRTVITPFSGYNSNRNIPVDDISRFMDRHPHHQITLIGWCPADYSALNDNGKRVQNMLNRTQVQDVVDIVCSANVVIGCTGFITILAAAAGIETFSIREPNVPMAHFHSEWKARYVDSINEVRLTA